MIIWITGALFTQRSTPIKVDLILKSSSHQSNKSLEPWSRGSSYVSNWIASYLQSRSLTSWAYEWPTNGFHWDELFQLHSRLSPIFLPAGVHLRTSAHSSKLYVNKRRDYDWCRLLSNITRPKNEAIPNYSKSSSRSNSASCVYTSTPSTISIFLAVMLPLIAFAGSVAASTILSSS